MKKSQNSIRAVYWGGMDEQEGQEKIIENLEELNDQVGRQNSTMHMLWMGIVYGVGFVLGSAILATILIGFFGPYIAQIPWIHMWFEAGSQLLHR